MPMSARQRRVALSRMASKMGCKSSGELAMLRSTSKMAVCCSMSSVTRSCGSETVLSPWIFLARSLFVNDRAIAGEMPIEGDAVRDTMEHNTAEQTVSKFTRRAAASRSTVLKRYDGQKPLSDQARPSCRARDRQQRLAGRGAAAAYCGRGRRSRAPPAKSRTNRAASAR